MIIAVVLLKKRLVYWEDRLYVYKAVWTGFFNIVDYPGVEADNPIGSRSHVVCSEHYVFLPGWVRRMASSIVTVSDPSGTTADVAIFSSLVPTAA